MISKITLPVQQYEELREMLLWFNVKPEFLKALPVQEMTWHKELVQRMMDAHQVEELKTYGLSIELRGHEVWAVLTKNNDRQAVRVEATN